MEFELYRDGYSARATSPSARSARKSEGELGGEKEYWVGATAYTPDTTISTSGEQRSEGAKVRVSRAEQAQAKAHDTRREWGRSPSNLSFSANFSKSCFLTVAAL